MCCSELDVSTTPSPYGEPFLMGPQPERRHNTIHYLFPRGYWFVDAQIGSSRDVLARTRWLIMVRISFVNGWQWFEIDKLLLMVNTTTCSKILISKQLITRY